MTRAEVVAHVEGAFAIGPLTPADLVEAAVRSGARPAVIEVLRGLPERHFAEPRELEVALAEVPVDGSSSEGASA